MADITVLVGIMGGVLSIAAYFAGRDKASKEEGKSDGIMLKDIEYIKKSMDAVVVGIRETNGNVACIDKIATSNNFKIVSIEKELKDTREEISKLKDEVAKIKSTVIV